MGSKSVVALVSGSGHTHPALTATPAPGDDWRWRSWPTWRVTPGVFDLSWSNTDYSGLGPEDPSCAGSV